MRDSCLVWLLAFAAPHAPFCLKAEATLTLTFSSAKVWLPASAGRLWLSLIHEPLAATSRLNAEVTQTTN